MARLLQPLMQGDLDGLCGLYSLLNGVQWALYSCRRSDVRRRRLPKLLSDAEQQALFDTLHRELPILGCDHSRRLARGFLELRGLRVDEVFSWLDEHGGYCDCEVLFNVEEHWERCRSDA